MTKISECMTQSCQWVAPETSLKEAAKIMQRENLGFLPVGENDKLIGMVTDRDIVIRGLAEGRESNDRVRDVMTNQTYYCYEDQSAEEVCANMGDLQIRRMPVMSRSKRLVGVVSFGDLAQASKANTVGEAEKEITSQLSRAKAA